MKVLLCEDVEYLGWLGDIVEVKNGYARNYLLPRRIATVPTEESIRSLAEEKTRRAEARQLVQEEKERMAEQVQGAEIVLTAKANELGHLFGSITEKDIAEGLQKQGHAITAEMVRMDSHIKEIGTREVALRIALDLRAVVQVTIVSEDQPVVADEETSGE